MIKSQRFNQYSDSSSVLGFFFLILIISFWSFTDKKSSSNMPKILWKKEDETFGAVEYHRISDLECLFTVHQFTFDCFSCIPLLHISCFQKGDDFQPVYVAKLNSCERRWESAECGLSTKFRIKKQVAQRRRSRSKRRTITGREERFWILLTVLFSGVSFVLNFYL